VICGCAGGRCGTRGRCSRWVWFVALVVVVWVCLGLVPDVDGVGEECGELEEVELCELLSVGDAGAGGDVGGAGAGVVAGVVGMTSIGHNGCSLWTDVQLY
jgi:hypothetical protein